MGGRRRGGRRREKREKRGREKGRKGGREEGRGNRILFQDSSVDLGSWNESIVCLCLATSLFVESVIYIGLPEVSSEGAQLSMTFLQFLWGQEEEEREEEGGVVSHSQTFCEGGTSSPH